MIAFRHRGKLSPMPAAGPRGARCIRASLARQPKPRRKLPDPKGGSSSTNMESIHLGTRPEHGCAPFDFNPESHFSAEGAVRSAAAQRPAGARTFAPPPMTRRCYPGCDFRRMRECQDEIATAHATRRREDAHAERASGCTSVTSATPSASRARSGRNARWHRPHTRVRLARPADAFQPAGVASTSTLRALRAISYPHDIRTITSGCAFRICSHGFGTTARLRGQTDPFRQRAAPSPEPSARRNTAGRTIRGKARAAAVRNASATALQSQPHFAQAPRREPAPLRRTLNRLADFANARPHVGQRAWSEGQHARRALARAAATRALARSSGEAAHTWHRSCVTMRSGARLLKQLRVHRVDAFAALDQLAHLTVEFGRRRRGIDARANQLGFASGVRWVIALVGNAHNGIAGADRIENFRRRGKKQKRCAWRKV